MTRKAAFEALAKLFPGIWNKPGTIKEMDEVLDAAGVKPDAPSEPERNMTPGKIGPEGIALIKQFEGCERMIPGGKVESYPDPGSGGVPWTVGWGSTKGLDGKAFGKGYTITQAEADWLLERDLVKYAEDVKAALGASLARTSQQQFDALVSWHYNCGAIARATLTAKHRAGDYAGAAAEFGKWVNASGKRMKGLVRRRAAEAALYREGSA